MRVALVAEGRGDLAVLANILNGELKLDINDIQFILPEYALDQTDLHTMRVEEFGGWVRVKEECISKSQIIEFIDNAQDSELMIVVQIDTAESHLAGFEVERPDRKDPNYATVLHGRTVEKMKTWLGTEVKSRICHAVAVEEIDAWVMTIFSDTDTTKTLNPKAKLRKTLNKLLSKTKLKALFQKSEYQIYSELSAAFQSQKRLRSFAKNNSSLLLFIESLGALAQKKETEGTSEVE